MYDIKQFKPALYILLVMGMTGYALASESPGIWILSVGAIFLNAWLVKTKRFTPMPRLLANAVTLLATTYVVLQVLQIRTSPILVIGQFLVLLQLVKLYEQRANRDYAQLLVLSLLLMVAASITTASLIFGILLIAYLFLSLYCCLLFHLKVETDDAKKLLAISEDKHSDVTLKQDQRFLSSSMRRLTMLVSSFALTLAIIVFLFFPRGAGAGLFGQFQFKPSQTLTGFSDEVSFQQVARISQNDEIVAYLKIFKNDVPVQGQQFYLRGVTLDTYSGAENRGGGQWKWSRSRSRDREQRFGLSERTPQLLTNPKGQDVYRQEFMLRPTGTKALFAIAGTTQITTDRRLDIRYFADDSVVEAVDALILPLNYTVVSSGLLPDNAVPAARRLRHILNGTSRRRSDPSAIDPKIKEFALKADVTGSDKNGPLAARRARLPVGDPNGLDDTIAHNIEHYLQSNFSYTLDLTDAKMMDGQDPMVSFLYDVKRGHCEYFAGAMALMCQSLGMDARVVVGFKIGADAYNNYSANYIVRQAYAHAWVEVNTPDGWKTFDPTSSREAASTAGNNKSFMDKMRGIFDYLEYTWANKVVAYDTESRESVIGNAESAMTNTAIQSSRVVSNLGSLLDMLPQGFLSGFIGIVIGLMVLGLLLAIAWFLWERYRLRKRAARIGLTELSAADQARLVRQLGFYDDLLQLLQRYQIDRPQHLTPMEFSQSLSFLPTEAFDSIRRLTQIFYRIRFGTAEIDPGQRKRLSRVLERVDESLATTYAPPAG